MRTFARVTALGCALAFGASFALTGCGSANNDFEPKITNINKVVSAENVLAYMLTVDTDEPTTVSVQVTPDDTTVTPWTVQGPTPAAKQNNVIIAGLRASSHYTLEVTVTDAGGRTAVDDSQAIDTDALPTDMPPITVVKSDPTQMQPGFTLFDIFSWLPSGGTDNTSGWLVMVDEEGKVVWYAHTPNRPEDSRLMPDGNIGYSYAGEDPNDSSKETAGFIELDGMSEVNKQWIASALPGITIPDKAIKVDVDAMHHEVYPMPNGDYLTLAPEMRKIGQSQCPNYSGTLNVVGDDIVEFDPSTGDIVHKVSEFDFLDPCRRTNKGFEAGFWNKLYGGITTQDWTHSNAVIYDAARKLVIVSIRHQDWLVGLKWPPSGNAHNDVAWLLGSEGNPGDYGTYPHFTPTGTPFAWQYHQHGPEVEANGDIEVFDNGNLRPGTDPTDPNNLPYSRAVRFQLDTNAMTIKQKWQYKSPDGNGGVLYCPFLGDVRQQANGDVLATFGGAVDPPSDNIAAPTEKKFGRIVEFNRTNNDAVVFQVEVRDPATSNFKSYSIYRANRITGFPR